MPGPAQAEVCRGHKEVLGGQTTGGLIHIGSYKSIDLAAGATAGAPLRLLCSVGLGWTEAAHISFLKALR